MSTGPVFLAFLLLAAGAAPPDAEFLKDHHLRIPLTIDPSRRATAARMELLYSTDEGKVWNQYQSVSSEATEFQFSAPADGLYWFSVGLYDKDGNRDPVSPSQAPPALKIYLDTVPPQVSLVSAARQGDEVVVQWALQEQFPSPVKSRIEYRTANMPANVWNPAPVSINPSDGRASWRPGNDYALTVRVHVEDLAGNAADTQSAEVPGNTPPPPGGGNVAAGPGALPTPGPGPGSVPGPQAPGQFPVRGDGGAWQPGGAPPAMPVSQLRNVSDPALGAPPAPGGVPVGPGQGLPPNRPNVVATTNKPDAQVVLTSVQQTPARPAAGAPPVGPTNLPALEYVNTPQVTVEFNITQVGSSGVSEVQVYITTDDGANWQPWARVQNASPITPGDTLKTPPGAALRKALVVELPGEGVFGLYLVVKSGVRRSIPAPQPGTPPQVRFEVDLRLPEAALFNPEAEAGRTDTLVFTWEAKDRNLTDKPILLEWSENHDGPWKVIGGELPNVPGRFVWKMPQELPAQVYLKLTVRDKAGNFGVAQTDQPIEVDWNLPRVDNPVILKPGR